jgi:hypothetical protein
MMKKLDRIWGYLDTDNRKAPFYFDTDTFELIVFSPPETCGHEDLYLWGKHARQFANVKEHKWIGACALHGSTAEGYTVIFKASEDFSLYHNTKIYQIHWLFYCPGEYDIQKIDGFNVTGEVINAFYSPTRALGHEVKFNDKGGLESVAVECRNPVESDAGSFCLEYDEAENTSSDTDDSTVAHKTLKVGIKLNAYASYTVPSESPLRSTSDMDFEYENPVSLSAVIENYRYVRNFFMYVCYRSDIMLDDTLVYWVNDDGRRNYDGRLVWRPGVHPTDDLSEDEKKKQKECIIRYELLKEHTAEIFSIVGNESFSYDHLVPNIRRRHSYPVSRFITILTAFEREYRNIYGRDSLRREAYKEFKQRVLEELNKMREPLHGKEREWMQSFIKGVSNGDDSYSSRFKKALEENMDVMEIFLDYSYNKEDGSTEAIAARVGHMRNDLAHNNLDMEILPINLADIDIVEVLLYCMRLREIGLSVWETQKAINDLFGKNFALGEPNSIERHTQG